VSVPDAELLARINVDRALGSQLLFPHRHAQVSPAFHVEIIDLWRSPEEFVLVEAFRGGGKTTIAEEFLTMEGAFGNFHYWMLIGETYSKACQRLEAIDKEARTNERLRWLFGRAVLARKSIENRVWFTSGAMIEAVGWEQEFQSFKYHDHRPDGAYLDDVENKERVRDSSAVDESMKKLYLELVPALDVTRRRIRFAQARRAEDCMVTRLARSGEWLYRAYPVCDRDPDDPEAVALWPERYPMSWVRAEKRKFQQSGMLSEFLQEYMLQAVDYEKKPFKPDMLASLDVSPWHWMPRYAIYDPSRSTRTARTKEGDHASDRTGKVVVSRMSSKILVHESGGFYWKPNELVDDLFRVQEAHRPVKIGIEKNSLDEWLLQPIRLAMLRNGVMLPLTTLQAPQDRSKEDFIMGLQPFASAGDVVLVGGHVAHPQLVAEWSNFPSGPRDVLNALAYALRMFGGVPMYEDFSAGNIGEAPTPRQGEEVYVGASATPSEVVAVACLRDGRRLIVAGDWQVSGALSDAVKTLAFALRTKFPRAHLQVWVPGEIFDQWQRIPLVPALRAERFAPYRAEHAAVARGCLAERMRQVWHGQRMLVVDREANGTLNALAAGYVLPPEKGGRTASEPEAGPSRLLAEALECMVAILDRTEDAMTAIPDGAHVAHSPGGLPYVSANPRARA